jgi:hypothetical protein
MKRLLRTGARARSRSGACRYSVTPMRRHAWQEASYPATTCVCFAFGREGQEDQGARERGEERASAPFGRRTSRSTPSGKALAPATAVLRFHRDRVLETLVNERFRRELESFQ